jgi:SsrA-binding protein
MAQSKQGEDFQVVASNRRASFDYALGERFEAGVLLTGGEVKSARIGKLDLRDAFVQIRNGEAWLVNAYIPVFEQATGFARALASGNERRDRKLLLHKHEIADLEKGIAQKGYTAIPTRAYLKRGWLKVEIALARGKKLYDKRETIAKRDAQREVQRALKERE